MLVIRRLAGSGLDFQLLGYVSRLCVFTAKSEKSRPDPCNAKRNAIYKPFFVDNFAGKQIFSLLGMILEPVHSENKAGSRFTGLVTADLDGLYLYNGSLDHTSKGY